MFGWLSRTCAFALFAGFFAALGALAHGQDKAPGSSPEAVTAYRDAANFQNNSAFDLAAEEWQKFLKNFPQDPLAAKARHYLGVCQLQLKQYEAAATSFEVVLKDHAKFEFLEDTYLNLGSAQYSLASAGKPDLYASSEITFATLLDKFPKSKYAEEALYYLGESLYAQGKKEQAATSYSRLVKEFDSSKRRADALYALGVTQEELGKHADAGKAYDLYLQEFSKLPLASEVRMRKAETVLQSGDVAQAVKLFAEVAKLRDFKAVDHALSRQAYCLAKLDKFAEAGSLYTRVVTDFEKSPYAPDAMISAGRCYYRANNLPEAQHWFARAAALKDANSVEAAHWLCRILIKQGDAPAAADIAGLHLAANPIGAFVPNLQMDQADALYEIPAKRADALVLYAKFAADSPQHALAPQALYNAAFTALGLKQYGDALQHATAFLQAYSQDKLIPDVKYVAAESHLQLKHYPDAEKLYRELAAKHAAHSDAESWRVRLGLVAYLQKQYDAAITNLAPIAGNLTSKEANAEASFVIGACHFHSDRFQEAKQALSTSLTTAPKWRQADEALLLLGRTEARLNQPADAKATFQKLLAEYPESQLLDQARYRLGELAYQANDFPAAITEYEAVISKWPASAFAPYAAYGKAWSQLKSKQHALAAGSFTSLVTNHPNHTLAADGLFGRALSRRQAGDPKGAIEDWDAYLKTNPDQAHRSEALHEKGLSQAAVPDFPAAVATLVDLLKSDPKYAAADKVCYEIGWALKSQNKHADAVPHFAAIAKNHPDSPLAGEAYFHVGEDHYEKRQYAEAAKAYAAASSKSPAPDLAEKATYKLGWAHYQLKNYSAGALAFAGLLASFPKGSLAADAAFMKAECLFRQENYKDAWPAYQTALTHAASSPTIEALKLLHGGQTAAQLKQWDESIKLLAQLIEKQKDSPLVAEALYEQAWAKQNLGRTADAMVDYAAAAGKSRDHVGARARFMLGELLFTEKKHDEAIREYQRAMFGYGGDQATSETKNWQAKSGYEAGRCAEVLVGAASDSATKQKHLADARRFYTFVAEKHATHELAAEAKKRLSALARL